MSHARMQVIFSAFALALRAKVGDVDQLDIDSLVATSEQMLGSDDPLTRAINTFATQYQVCHLDKAIVARLGDDLASYCQSQTYMLQASAPRVDIYG